AFNHAGDRLASRCWDGTVRLWDPWSGKQLFSTEAGTISMPCFSPDDRLLAAEQRESKLAFWQIAAGREYRTQFQEPDPDKAVWRAAISPDNRLLAVGTSDGVRLCDLASGADLAVLPIG